LKPKVREFIVVRIFTLIQYIDGDLCASDDNTEIDRQVECAVKSIVDQLKRSHEKFIDPDFGPTSTDEYGANSLYVGSPPDPAGSKYPPAGSLRWTRPVYDDDKFHHNHKDGSELEKQDEEDGEGEDEFSSGRSYGGVIDDFEVSESEIKEPYFFSRLTPNPNHHHDACYLLISSLTSSYANLSFFLSLTAAGEFLQAWSVVHRWVLFR
jgi:hypothetical protein